MSSAVLAEISAQVSRALDVLRRHLDPSLLAVHLFDWTMARLPPEHRSVLHEARQAYLGQGEDRRAARAEELAAFVRVARAKRTDGSIGGPEPIAPIVERAPLQRCP